MHINFEFSCLKEKKKKKGDKFERFLKNSKTWASNNIGLTECCSISLKSIGGKPQILKWGWASSNRGFKKELVCSLMC